MILHAILGNLFGTKIFDAIELFLEMIAEF
jgi:hypothetical protein